MEALANLGVDWKLFLAQGINFLILLFILQRFAYKPMLRFLEERSAKIEKGLKDAESASTKLDEVVKKEQAVLKKAQVEAKKIIDEATAAAKLRDAEQLEKTKAEVAALLEASQKNITEERARALREAKQELGALVVLAAEKLVGIKVDAEKDNELIKKSLS